MSALTLVIEVSNLSPGAIIMNRYIQADDRKQTRDALAAKPTHTTLYDLIGAMHDEAGSNASDVILAAVVHVFKTHRVSCLGNFVGCRMTLGAQEVSHRAVA